MSWSITVIPPDDSFPDVQEVVSSVSRCPGNFYMCVLELKDRQLREMTTDDERISSLRDVILEIDKGNDGLFSDNYCVEADKAWSDGRETMDEWNTLQSYYLSRMPFKTYEQFCGYHVRERMRKDAVRFFLYYKAGYKIEYVW